MDGGFSPGGDSHSDWVAAGGNNPVVEAAVRYSYRAATGDDTDEEEERIRTWMGKRKNPAPSSYSPKRGLSPFSDASSPTSASVCGSETLDTDCAFDDAIMRVGNSVRQSGHSPGLAQRCGSPQQQQQQRGAPRAKRRRTRCWGCQYGVMAGEAKASTVAMKGLVRLIRENHGKMSDCELSMIVADYHRTEIEQPAIDAGLHCDQWTATQVLQHLRHHTLDPRMVIGENISTLRCVIRETRKKVIKRNDDTGEETVDPRNVDTMLKSMKTLMELYSKKPEDLMFGENSMPGSTATDDYVISQRRALTAE